MVSVEDQEHLQRARNWLSSTKEHKRKKNGGVGEVQQVFRAVAAFILLRPDFRDPCRTWEQSAPEITHNLNDFPVLTQYGMKEMAYFFYHHVKTAYSDPSDSSKNKEVQTLLVCSPQLLSDL